MTETTATEAESKLIAIEEIQDSNELIQQGQKRFASFSQILAVYLLGGVLVGNYCFFIGEHFFGGMFCFSIFAAPFFLIALFSRASEIRDRKQRLISLSGGKLTITLKSRTSESWRLSDCHCWYRGIAKNDCFFQNQPIQRESLVLVLPNYQHLACGLNEEDFARWLTAISNSGCQEVSRWGAWFKGQLLGLVVFGFLAGAALGLYLAKGIFDQFGLVPPGPSLFCTIMFATAWTFAILPFSIPYFHLYEEATNPKGFYGATVLLPFKVSVLPGIITGELTTGLIAGGFFAAYILATTHFAFAIRGVWND